jgi:hypothetical protein
MLANLEGISSGGAFILKDLHRHMEDPVVVRRLRGLCRALAEWIIGNGVPHRFFPESATLDSVVVGRREAKRAAFHDTVGRDRGAPRLGDDAGGPNISIRRNPIEFAAIDYHLAAGYALCNGSDLPPGHEHFGCSRL